MMEKPMTLCDRCEKQFSCLLNYDGVPCRKNRTVEPTNYDRIISKSPEELAEWINNEYGSMDWCPVDAPVDPVTRKCLVHDDCAECIVDWLKQEAE